MAPKQKYNFRLSDEAKRLLEVMSANMGIPQTNVLELAIRAMAAEQNVDAQPVDRMGNPLYGEHPPRPPHALPSFGNRDS